MLFRGLAVVAMAMVALAWAGCAGGPPPFYDAPGKPVPPSMQPPVGGAQPEAVVDATTTEGDWETATDKPPAEDPLHPDGDDDTSPLTEAAADDDSAEPSIEPEAPVAAAPPPASPAPKNEAKKQSAPRQAPLANKSTPPAKSAAKPVATSTSKSTSAAPAKSSAPVTTTTRTTEGVTVKFTPNTEKPVTPASITADAAKPAKPSAANSASPQPPSAPKAAAPPEPPPAP